MTLKEKNSVLNPGNHELGASIDVTVVRVRDGVVTETVQQITTEVPLTIIANEVEIGTVLCSPASLKELAIGFLYSSAFINSMNDVTEVLADTSRWVVSFTIARTPNPEVLTKRMYTPGCGKGVMYSSLNESGLRMPLQSSLTITVQQILALSSWLQHCSELYRTTGGIHTAALSENGALPAVFFDDIGRHNAVDKVIGDRLMVKSGFVQSILVSSGRVSSEILHKARRAGIAIVIARGAPTHQSVLRARDTGITLICFARGSGFTVYSHKERVSFDSI